ncbi:hypothetical protein A0H81_02356 [Grifola frondosa]|uniref:Uncharacterized protein n=1 Tax=Grifola frondosa TaxID=5627 RepID=A0A1C7MKM7_GRIFR|nr:hypothetical protein A0H81_02356 [Grifola frondosa]
MTRIKKDGRCSISTSVSLDHAAAAVIHISSAVVRSSVGAAERHEALLWFIVGVDVMRVHDRFGIFGQGGTLCWRGAERPCVNHYLGHPPQHDPRDVFTNTPTLKVPYNSLITPSSDLIYHSIRLAHDS